MYLYVFRLVRTVTALFETILNIRFGDGWEEELMGLNIYSKLIFKGFLLGIASLESFHHIF
jgi:hypothetical protein